MPKSTSKLQRGQLEWSIEKFHESTTMNYRVDKIYNAKCIYSVVKLGNNPHTNKSDSIIMTN